MNLTLSRKIKTENSTIGDLLIDGIPFGKTLELPWHDNQHNISCIPPGTYRVGLSLSEHFKGLVPVLINVPNRDGIEMHVGNYPKDVHGCIAVGLSILGPDFIGDSVKAFNMLLIKIHTALSDSETISIEVKEGE